jgi:hypothetical protein
MKENRQQARDTLFWTIGVVGMRIQVLHSKLHSFGNISIISGITQIPVRFMSSFTHLLQVP